MTLQCHACGVEFPANCSNPDPCLGVLDGVRYACCGHGGSVLARCNCGEAYGIPRIPYVVFSDGSRLDGADAATYFRAVAVAAP